MPAEMLAAFSHPALLNKRMHMVGHDDIAPDRPAMAIMGISPLVNQYCCDFF